MLFAAAGQRQHQKHAQHSFKNIEGPTKRLQPLCMFPNPIQSTLPHFLRRLRLGRPSLCLKNFWLALVKLLFLLLQQLCQDHQLKSSTADLPRLDGCYYYTLPAIPMCVSR